MTLRGITRYPEMKIGGVPFWLHPPETPSGMRFLGSFSGVDLVSDFPFPIVNDSSVIGLRQSTAEENMLRFTMDVASTSSCVRTARSIGMLITSRRFQRTIAAERAPPTH